MRFLIVTAVFLLALLAGGCGLIIGGDDENLDLNWGGNNGGNNNSGNNGEVTQFDVFASAGATPTYTWEGGGAHSVSVVRADNPATISWSVAFLGLTNGINSSVVHGTVPPGAVEAIRAEPVLTVGVTYRVSVARDGGDEIGWVEFTP